MSFINLTEDEFIHIKIIDEQHLKFINFVNMMYNAVGNDNKIKILMHEFREALENHINTENNLMKEHKDPNFISHSLEHQRMIRKVDELNSKIQNGTEKLGFDFLNSFRNWFFNHNKINDKKTGAFLKEKGLK